MLRRRSRVIVPALGPASAVAVSQALCNTRHARRKGAVLARTQSNQETTMASIGDTPRMVVGVAVKTWLFVAQCNNRIYRRGSPRGDVRCGGPHNQHQNRDTGV